MLYILPLTALFPLGWSLSTGLECLNREIPPSS